MRLNRETIGILVASVVVIVMVLLLSNPASAPEETPTPQAGEGGPLFPNLEAETVVRVQIVDGENGDRTVLVKDEGGAWNVDEATNDTDRATDQEAVENALSTFVGLEATNSFVEENLADFGLDTPAYTLTASATTEDGEEQTYTIHIGNESPATPRYYALREGDEEQTIYLVQQATVDDLINLIAEPPYVPPPTDTPTPFPTPNPYSEVEQTATAEIEQTATAEFAPTATFQAEATATAEAEMTATPEEDAVSTEETEEEAVPTEETGDESEEASTAEATERPTPTPEPES